jgi:phosphoserine phosphatase RsbU/P
MTGGAPAAETAGPAGAAGAAGGPDTRTRGLAPVRSRSPSRRTLIRVPAALVLVSVSLSAFAASGQASSPPGAPPKPGKSGSGQAGAPPAPGPAPARPQRGAEAEASTGSSSTGAPSVSGSGAAAATPSTPAEGSGASANQISGGGQAATSRQEPAAKSSPGRVRREKAKRTSPKGEVKTKAQEGQSPPASGSTGTGSVSAPATNAASPSVGSTTTTAGTAHPQTPAAPISAQPEPVVGAHSPQAAGRPGHARHGSGAAPGWLAGHPALGGASASAALGPLAALATAPVGEGAAAAGSPPASRRPAGSPRTRPAATRQSPLVTTFTRIVDVVPTPVRVVLIALLVLALGLAVRAWMAALRARRLEQQRAQLLEDVGLLQEALLPQAPARVGPVRTSVAYRPAAGPAAGGDFYDVFALDDGGLAVIVGDISGHGREALPHTALVRYTLRAYLEAGLSPRASLQTAGAVLERQLGGSFATVLAATYRPGERRLVYACAGHPPPVILGSQPLAAVTACSAPPLGAGMRTGTRQTTVALPGRSQVCFHTDGVTEARIGAELFGAARLQRTLAELGPGASATALLDGVAEQVDARPDDMAACLLSIEGGSQAPAALVEELELDRHSAASERTGRFLRACGVGTREAAEVMLAAQAAARRAGTVVLTLRLGRGAPEVELRQDTVTLLRAARVSDPDNMTDRTEARA